jgi:two-component system, OmpR family, aerobic respiration control sensor histidine kinase ArcB
MNNKEKEEDTTKIIHSLKEKISQLEEVIALLPGHVYWLNKDLVIQGCNDALARASYVKSRKEIIGKTHHDMLWKSHADEMEKHYREIMEKGIPHISEETVTLPQGEITRVYLSHKAPLKNANNEVTGLLGISLDITDRKHMEKELEKAKEAAEFANEAKTELIRNLEHDIRTPLGGIMNVVTYLQTIEGDPQKKEFLSDIHIATHEVLNYLENIVESSDISMGQVPLILRTFDFKQVIQAILNLESAAAKDKRIELIMDYPEDVPKMVIGDRFRVHRVLLNLISNAIKFTDVGFMHVNVRMIEEKEQAALFEIKVKDSGIGIAPKYHQLIFDKFMRCDPSNRGIYKGKGLGLWIVKQFIHDLQGTISLESVLGKGSTFQCCLPFKLQG